MWTVAKAPREQKAPGCDCTLQPSCSEERYCQCRAKNYSAVGHLVLFDSTRPQQCFNLDQQNVQLIEFARSCSRPCHHRRRISVSNKERMILLDHPRMEDTKPVRLFYVTPSSCLKERPMNPCRRCDARSTNSINVASQSHRIHVVG